MLDPKLLRNEIEFVAKRLQVRGFELDVARIQELEVARKELQVKTQELQNERNLKSKSIGQAKAKGESVDAILAETKVLGQALDKSEAEFEGVKRELQAIYQAIPNIPDESVPAGNSEDDNVEVRKWGEIPKFDFAVKDHIELGKQFGLMDFDVAAKIAGARFVVLHKDLARLHRALIQFMLDIQIKQHGYNEVYVPYIVNKDSLFGTGQLPKFEQDQFKLRGEQNYYLIPTAEVPITNLIRDEIIDSAQLPLKFVAHTPCFRSEAGSHGKDTRGMIRQHQFEKVELVQLVQPEQGQQALETLTKHAEVILQKLNLPYRVVTLCGGDLGFCAHKTYDLEVWLPGQNCYREISSCSHFGTFQARRMQARYRDPNTNKPALLHTLNGSGLAAGRTLIALMENHQTLEGHINIPEALQPYCDGMSKLPSV